MISGDDITRRIASRRGCELVDRLFMDGHDAQDAGRRTPAASGHVEQIVILASGQASSMHYTAKLIRYAFPFCICISI